MVGQLKFLLLGFFFFISTNASLQNIRYWGALPSFQLNFPITPKTSLNLFISSTISVYGLSLENNPIPKSDLQFYFQPSLVIEKNAQIKYSFSYTYQRNNPFNAQFINEHRLWEQINFTRSIKQLQLTNRFRLEQRFIENHDAQNYPISIRLRYQLGVNFPILRKKICNTGVYGIFSNESYFSCTQPRTAFYSENWTLIGIGFTFKNNKDRLETGFLRQILVINHLSNLRILNLLSVSWIHPIQ